MKKSIFSFLFFITCTNLFSQIHLKDIPVIKSDVFESSNVKKSNSQKKLFIKTVEIEPVVTNSLIQHSQVLTTLSTFPHDGVLYRNVVRKYTWLEGLGEPISQEVANHLPYYFRLSSKNVAGHYQLVEAMHGDKLTTMHPLSTYILNKEDDDSENNKEWIDRLKTVGQWMFYSDHSGQNVVEERAFEAKEKDAKLVYSMIPVRSLPNKVTISYLDAYGYPADMNEIWSNTYGSVVVVTYDENGYDSIIDYLDGQGYRKANTDNVDQRRYKYDKQGHVLLATSNNFIGDNVIDNWGNCGVRYDYDKDSYMMTYLDDKMTPMRMPSSRAGAEDTYICRKFILDKWGRKKEAIILDENGNPDTTLSNIHRIVYYYTDDGLEKGKEFFDINNNPIVF